MEPFVIGKMCSFLKEFSIIHKHEDIPLLNKTRANRDSWAIWLLNLIYLQKLLVKPCTLLPTRQEYPLKGFNT